MKNSSHNIERPQRQLGRNPRGELGQRLAASYPATEWIRLPQPGAREFVSGLSRSTLNELILPSAANDYRPPVKSIVLKKRGATRGIRLIHAESLLLFLNSLAEQSRLENDERAEETGVRPEDEDPGAQQSDVGGAAD